MRQAAIRRPGSRFIEFTAQTRMSGVDLPDGRRIRKGRPTRSLRYVQQQQRQRARRRFRRRSTRSPRRERRRCSSAREAESPAWSCSKTSSSRACASASSGCASMGLRTVMVTGDNPLTAKAIAEQAGVDDFIAQATPEAKLAYIRKEQAGGKLVAMMGDGTNDAPALAQADVGVAMNSGTQAAKEAGNMVDLDSDPTKLIEVVEIGKQLLMTRGALTTFSIANDLAKYFAIVPGAVRRARCRG